MLSLQSGSAVGDLAKTESVSQQREILESRIINARQALQKDLHEALQRLRSQVPPEWLILSLGEFLQLENFTTQLESFLFVKNAGKPSLPTEPSRGKRQTMVVDKVRRVTRSMAAKQSLASSENNLGAEVKRKTLLIGPTTQNVPETPKFHPGLPETPAHIRRGGRPRKSSAITSNIFNTTGRTSTSTAHGAIRASITRISSVRKRGRESQLGGAGLMSLELEDGKMIDVDITASPSKLVAHLGVDAVREMKTKMQAYANQLKSFFKRLRQRPEDFYQSSDGGYTRLKQWTRRDWRCVKVLTGNGCIDCFTIFDTATSILPIPNSGMKLACPMLGLRFVSSLDVCGNALSPTAESPKNSPIHSSSSLEYLGNGLVGQINSDAFFIAYEWVDKEGGTVYDLKPHHIVVPSGGVGCPLENRISLSSSGHLAYVAEGPEILISSLFNTLPPKRIPLGQIRVECIAWISEHRLAVAAIAPDDKPHLRIFNCNRQDLGSFSTVRLHSDVPIKRVNSMIASPADGYVLCCLELHDTSQALFLYRIAQEISTSGCSSKLALLQESSQILHLRISSNLFSSTHAEEEATAINIRDSSFLWELIDIPFETFLRGSLNGPPRLVVADTRGEWLAVAGQRAGFCLCHLSKRKWLLFDNPSEESDIRVDLLEWVDVPGLGGGTILAIAGYVLSSGQNEFWLLSPNVPITMKTLLHRQEARKKVHALCSSGQGQLGILSEDLLLQVIKLSSESPDSLSISILISASLEAFKSSSLPPCREDSSSGWKIFFSPQVYVESDKFHLFMIHHHDRLWKVLVPPQEDQEHREVVAHILPLQGVVDFWIWEPAGQLWLIVDQADKNLSCYKWPFVVDKPDLVVELPSAASAFYPRLAGGMVVLFEQLLHMGLQERDMYRIGVEQTVSLLPHLLHHQLKHSNSVEFSEFFRRLLHSFKSTPHEFALICELFYLQILTAEGEEEQTSLFARLADMLPSVLGPPAFRATVAGFFRKIELSEAVRIMKILGPFDTFFEGAIKAERVDMAWTYLRIMLLGRGTDKDLGRMSREDGIAKVLAAAFESRQLDIFEAACELAMECKVKLGKSTVNELARRIANAYAWSYLESLMKSGTRPNFSERDLIIPLEERIACLVLFEASRPALSLNKLLATPRDHDQPDEMISPITKMLIDCGFPVDAALWSFIVDGNLELLEKCTVDGGTLKETMELVLRQMQ